MSPNQTKTSDRRHDGEIVVCVDFGTAASKVAIARELEWEGGGAPDAKTLPIGLVAGNADPMMTPSAVFIDNSRLYFGPAALNAARSVGFDSTPVQSFKMLLGAADLKSVLDLKLRRSIDPTGRLKNGHLVLLYIGYLVALSETCIAADPNLAPLSGAVRWKYSHPAWPSGSIAENKRQTTALFERGISIGRQLRDAYLQADGVPFDRAMQTIETIGPGASGLVSGGVFEARAAGAVHAYERGAESRHILVLDMGAGTTDLDGFTLDKSPSGRVIATTIPQARLTIQEAGDEIDKILMNAVLARSKKANSVKVQSAMWRSMSVAVRDIKRQAFVNDRCAVEFQNETIVLTRQELERSPEFKALVKALEKHFQQSLAAVCAVAKSDQDAKVSVVLAGGGAALPFVQAMAQRAARGSKKGVRVTLEPIVPKWVLDAGFPDAYCALFPQLKVAIGGTAAAASDPDKAA